jgi:succinate-semialdehyde dehydrogenase / glutarate-semialdehyde dehydrogenase
MYERFGLFLNGRWTKPIFEKTVAVFSPVTEDVLGDCPYASSEDTQIAIASAEFGFKAWRSFGAFARSDSMHRIADEMVRRTDEAARMISTETGKPIAQAQREWSLSTDQFRWYAEEARRIYGRIVERPI